MTGRFPRLRRLRKAGALTGQFAKAAAPAALSYGVGVHGGPPTVIEPMPKAMRSVWCEPGRAGSAWVSSFLHGGGPQDPRIAAWAGPMYQWCLLCWGQSQHDLLQHAWQRQVITIYASRQPWGQVAGPAGATLLAFRSLHWVSSSAFAVKTDRGDALGLREASPLA
eukprot:6207971-Pyramimonas_sp.AAC.1